MSVWYCCPSKRSPEEAERTLAKWGIRNYKIALYLDEVEGCPNYAEFAVARNGGYPGYAQAQNFLCEEILRRDPEAQWLVCGADDVEPDPNHTAEEIAEDCRYHFEDVNLGYAKLETFGVMQPTGDRWGDVQGPYIDRVAGSPWIGREFARRMYGGAGPYWHEYTHMGVDEELQAVAIKMGVFWQRPDLTHYHNHWGRPRTGERMGQADRMPAFLTEANSPAHWKRYKELLRARQAAGFPGHEPIP